MVAVARLLKAAPDAVLTDALAVDAPGMNPSLEYGSGLTEDALAELVRTARWKPVVPNGQYL